jgi:4-diphosphocytidyl-2-C-methyl-D-erythritol kinase
MVLANPGVPVSTRDVFRRLARHSGPPESLPTSFADVAALADALEARVNDLAEPAVTVAPEIVDVLSALRAAPGNLLSRLSGSGPTCFGFYPDRAAARAAAMSIAADNPSWWVRAGVLS